MRLTNPLALALVLALVVLMATPLRAQPPAADDDHVAWWREARFGMFIHWGLYAIPAGRWDGKPVGSAGEWIQHIGRIPIDDYETLAPRFDPKRFDADAWVRLARDAGMRYLVITTKHHDGFALFDSKVSEWDVMSTPWRRDIMKDIAEACRRHGVRLGWYHSILDWHHPDYLPKRDWHEPAADDVDYDRYVEYLHAQVREILTNYGTVDIMWFDGEWDGTWTHQHGLEMAELVRTLQPDIVMNNRVDKARYPGTGPDGTVYGGDFGTPEQHIPDVGLPGVDWETCMTMNDTWGFKTDDHNWKSTEDLLRKLVDIASKGGNFLLNVGPTAAGEIPPESVERLRAMGAWLEINGESIYGTEAGAFTGLEWGRCTTRRLPGDDTRLYLHVFQWPQDGRLVLPGLASETRGARLLGPDGGTPLRMRREEDALVVQVPRVMPDPLVTVVALDVAGTPAVIDPPGLEFRLDRFVDAVTVTIVPTAGDGAQVRYTVDGTTPTAASPVAPETVTIDATTVLAARHFRDGVPISGVHRRRFEKETPRPASAPAKRTPGLRYTYYEIDCNTTADLETAEPAARGTTGDLDISVARRGEHYGFRFEGFLRVPRDGMYELTLSSDDGSILRIGGKLVVDCDGIHAAVARRGAMALAAGDHPVEVLMFEKGGDESLDLWIEGPGMRKRRVDGSMLFR